MPPLPAPLCLRVPTTLEAQLVLKRFYRQGMAGSQPPRAGSCRYPVAPACPSPRGPGSDPAWFKTSSEGAGVTPALGQSVLPGAEVPPRGFWQGSVSLGQPVSTPGGWCLPGGSQPNPGPALGASVLGSAAKLAWETRRVASQGLRLPRQLGHVTGPGRSWGC